MLTTTMFTCNIRTMCGETLKILAPSNKQHPLNVTFTRFPKKHSLLLFSLPLTARPSALSRSHHTRSTAAMIGHAPSVDRLYPLRASMSSRVRFVRRLHSNSASAMCMSGQEFRGRFH